MLNLAASFNQKEFSTFIHNFFPDFVQDERPVPKQNEIFPSITYLGASEKLRTSVLVIHTTLGLNSRITLTKASFKILKNFGIYRALVVYLNPDQTIWRLSLLTAQPIFSEGKVIEQFSNPQRHSYVLGSEVGVATARKFIVGMGPVSDFEDLQLRFSIEAINKEFYSEIAEYFYDLIGRYDQHGKVVAEPLLQLPSHEGHRSYQEYAIRLFGRIIFCWFLKEKKGESGSQLLPSALFDDAVLSGDNILNGILEPLFFSCLNVPASDRSETYLSSGYEDVPYLNGGLFHPHEGVGGDYYAEGFLSSANVPDIWFKRLFKTLSTFNFTLDENLNFDVELSIDPEMLGRIFENLLAEINPESGESARRTTGSFYTPRKIVDHMAEISLREFLLSKLDISIEKIDALMTLDSLEDSDSTLSVDEKRTIAAALYRLKSLDPACGSGAYPIGLLQKLLFILEQVDPDFSVGREMLPKGYLQSKPHLEGNSSYLRKLVLIRDVIHGADIQPVAIEISKLRCFLTLIIEQDVLDHLPNRGLESLPNLDFQFVCANSLIPLSGKDEALIFGDDDYIENELEEIRQEYYTTTSKAKKDNLKKRYHLVVNQELSIFGESLRTTQLKTFRPFTPNSQADFFDPRAMFGIDKFDIVIGNPPYVKVEHLPREVVQELKNTYQENHLGKPRQWVDDLYVHFIFRAFELVDEIGVVCFITNDSFISLDSKARVREKLLSENLIELIGCPIETFGATIYTAIFLARKSKQSVPSYFASRFEFPGFELSPKSEIAKEFVNNLPKKRFVLQESNLVARLLQNPPLRSFARVVDAGIHTGNVRDKILSKAPTSSATQRLVQGKQIVRWAVDWDNPGAKYKYCNPRYVPSEEMGIGRGGKPSKHKEYWHFAGDESNHFLPERGLLRQTSDHLLAAFHSIADDGQLYTDNTLFTVISIEPSHLKYFIALLNSRVLNYVYQFLSSEEGKALAQVKTGLVELLPAKYDASLAPEITKIVNDIIALRRADPICDVSNLERRLDRLVADLFELTAEDRLALNIED